MLYYKMYCQLCWNYHSNIKNEMANNVSITNRIKHQSNSHVLYTLYYEVWGNGYENNIPPYMLQDKKQQQYVKVKGTCHNQDLPLFI